MFEDMKLIPRSQFAPAAGVSREYVENVIRKLRDDGLIDPRQTPTGREFLSVSDARIVWVALRAKQ